MLVSGGCASDALLPRPAEAPPAAGPAEAMAEEVKGLTPAAQPPGNGPTSIRWRCGGQPSASRPLVIVDGRVLPEDRLRDIDPDQIESIEILRAQQAVPIYGHRAADGVILIRTKRR
ncbi:MAG TPA: TonB-dependent receptor plug domain-containing protein [Longimicrobium sp.]|nr:TonB-dependent receptor plug domain-containing protein [Longimicrobium sp.]